MLILPTAPQAAVSINGGHKCNSWFDITQLQVDERTDLKTVVSQRDIEAQVQTIADLCKWLRETKHIHKIHIGGFSQGSMLSLACFLS